MARLTGSYQIAEDYFYKKSAMNYKYLGLLYNTDKNRFEVLFTPPTIGNYKALKVMGTI